ERDRRSGRDSRGEIRDGAVELVGRHDAVDEAESLGMLRVDGLARERELLRLADSHSPNEIPRRAVVEAQAAPGEHERQLARSEHQIRSAASARLRPAPTA